MPVMDERTLAAYDQNPAEFCRTWLTQPAPEEIYRTIRKYFRSGGITADIGSGSGRDTDWLNRNGYPCTGYELSAGLRREAARLFPDCTFMVAELPALDGIASAGFDNVLCETVLMHMPAAEQKEAVENLLRILRPEGVMRLSWRLGRESNVENRDDTGRLYNEVAIDKLLAGLPAEMLESGATRGVSGAIIHHVILRKTT